MILSSLEAQFPSNEIDVTDLVRQTVTHGTFSYFGHISVVCGPIWTFFTVLPSMISHKEAIFDG